MPQQVIVVYETGPHQFEDKKKRIYLREIGVQASGFPEALLVHSNMSNKDFIVPWNRSAACHQLDQRAEGEISFEIEPMRPPFDMVKFDKYRVTVIAP